MKNAGLCFVLTVFLLKIPVLLPAAADPVPVVSARLSAGRLSWTGFLTNVITVRAGYRTNLYLEYPADPRVYGLQMSGSSLRTSIRNGKVEFMLTYVFQPKFAGTIKMKKITLKVIDPAAGMTNIVYSPDGTVTVLQEGDSSLFGVLIGIILAGFVVSAVLIYRNKKTKNISGG